MEKANVFINDMIISKFAGVLGGFNAIESSDKLNEELQEHKLLKRDVESIVSQYTVNLRI